MTVFRYLCTAIGVLSLLGAILPTTRVSPGRFSRTLGPPLARGARVAMLVIALLGIGLAVTCGRS